MKCGEFGGTTAKGEKCTKPAGWGRDASGGPCKYHVRDGRQRQEDGDQVPEPPPGLSEQAAETWRAVLEDWVLSSEELLVLQGALESWDLYREARANLRESGPVSRNSDSGAVKRNPAALVARDALRDYRDGIRQLGLEHLPEE